MDWHYALGHLNINAIKKMTTHTGGNIITLTDESWKTCNACATAKASKSVQPKRSERKAQKPGHILSADIVGEVKPATAGGRKYVSLFIDHYSSYADIKLLYNKESESVLEHFKEFHKQFERQSGEKLKILRTDNGKEYVSNTFQEYLRNEGIIHERTSPYTPAQNGKAERKNRTLFEAARAMRIHAGLDEEFWGEAVSTACYLQNRLPHSALEGRSPYQIIFENKPDLSFVKVFGSRCWVYRENLAGKVGARSDECILMGYVENARAYRVMRLSDRKLLQSINVEFERSNPVSNEIELLENDVDEKLVESETEIPEEEFYTPDQSYYDNSVDRVSEHSTGNQQETTPTRLPRKAKTRGRELV